MLRGLPTALERGLVEIDEIDAAALRVLTLKERLGLFDDPYRRGASLRRPTPSKPAARRQLAREAARRAIVVLTNSGVLPLAAATRRIAVVGPMANARAEMRGSWSAARRAQTIPSRSSRDCAPRCHDARSSSPKGVADRRRRR